MCVYGAVVSFAVNFTVIRSSMLWAFGWCYILYGAALALCSDCNNWCQWTNVHVALCIITPNPNSMSLCLLWLFSICWKVIPNYFHSFIASFVVRTSHTHTHTPRRKGKHTYKSDSDEDKTDHYQDFKRFLTEICVVCCFFLLQSLTMSFWAPRWPFFLGRRFDHRTSLRMAFVLPCWWQHTMHRLPKHKRF